MNTRPLVAVMQPYFLPYTGYFRLFEMADVFIYLDSVQFPRRGFVHRNRFVSANNLGDWLTLSIAKSPVHTSIKDLQLHPDTDRLMRSRLDQYSAFSKKDPLADEIAEVILSASGSAADLIIRLTDIILDALDICCLRVRASDLSEPTNVTAQERIISLVKQVGGTAYINSPGGRDLYEREVFVKNNIELDFLPPFKGSNLSVVQDVVDHGVGYVAEDVRNQCAM